MMVQLGVHPLEATEKKVHHSTPLFHFFFHKKVFENGCDGETNASGIMRVHIPKISILSFSEYQKLMNHSSANYNDIFELNF